jgi:DNA-binding MarR family transcriptional regulator
MDERMVLLRRQISLLQVSMNRAFGFDLGKKGDLSQVGAFIVYQCHFYRLRMKDLAAANKVSKSTMTQYVDSLEKKGYVRRVRGEKDRRDIYIEPTEKAKAWVDATEKKIFTHVATCLARLTPEEQTQFIPLFNKFVGDPESMPYDRLFELAIKNDFKPGKGESDRQALKENGVLLRREKQ